MVTHGTILSASSASIPAVPLQSGFIELAVLFIILFIVLAIISLVL